MGNQQGQPPWPPSSGQPPNWYPPNQGWGSPQQTPRGQQPPPPPPQWHRPQQNTQYPPQWQPRPPYPQQQQYYPPYQQQYYPPPTPPPPPPPKKKNTAWIVIGVFVGLVLLCGLISNTTHSQSSSTDNTSTTSDVQPTDTPTPAPLTNSDDIKSEIQSDANSTLTGDNINADYGTQLSKAVIFETTSAKQPLSFIQSECFNIQKAVWQDQQLNLKIVDFAIATINGQFPDVYGECVLDSSSAGKIDWNTTDAVTAWNNKVYQDMTPSN